VREKCVLWFKVLLFPSDTPQKTKCIDPSGDSGKQVLRVSFRGYLRPCDFANPAFGPLCISTEDCRCGQTRLHAHTYRCSRRENDWRLKKRELEKESSSVNRDGRTVNDQSAPVSFILSLLSIRGIATKRSGQEVNL